MKRELAYLKYILRHKWYVALGCIEMKVPLWRAVIHDWTKFTKREFMPYANNFFTDDGKPIHSMRDRSGQYNPNDQPDAFKLAWVSHQRNKHHWQAWVSIGNAGTLTVLPMDEVSIREMIADWIGAGRAISGRRDPNPWYEANKDKMLLHPKTRERLEELLKNAHGTVL